MQPSVSQQWKEREKKLDEACDTVGRVKGLPRGHLELDVIPSLHRASVPQVLCRSVSERPGVSITVHERPTRGVEREVESARIAVGLCVRTRNPPNLSYERLATEPLVWIARDDPELARWRSVSPPPRPFRRGRNRPRLT